MLISDEHHILKSDLDGAASALGVTVQRQQQLDDQGRRNRTVTLMLPRPTAVCARFVRESFLRRAEKLFVNEVEVGTAWFDDLIFVITSTREATADFLKAQRVQQALVLLVDEDRHVEIEADELRLVDDDANDDGRDALAELLALAKHLDGAS
jgi:hypothetical protein